MKAEKKCEWCGEMFAVERTKRGLGRRFCSRKCVSGNTFYKTRKLPTDAILAKLYVMENLSLEAIGERYGVHGTAVFHRLKRAGIERRAYTRGRAGGKRPGVGRKKSATA